MKMFFSSGTNGIYGEGKARISLTIGFCILCFLFVQPNLWSKSLTAPQWFQEGQDAQRAADWYGAVECYQEALRVNDAYGDAWYALAECSYALNEYSLALNYLESAAKFAKDKVEILNLTGFCYLGLNRIQEAQNLFNQVLASYPNNIEARFGLAQLDILAGRLTGAETRYIDALKRQQSNRNALLAVALVSQEMGKTEEAQNYIQQALRYHSKDEEVQYIAGWISFLNQDYSDTEYRVRTSINLNPDFDKSYELLATVLYQQGRFQEAVDICDYRINRNREASTAWYLKGCSLKMMGRMQEAYSVLEKGLEIVPQDEMMRSALEQIVLDTFDVEDARRSKWAQYHIAKARNHEKQYETPQAEFEYKQALRLNPLDVSARTSYANMLDRKGQQELYLEQLNFISSIQPVSVKVADTIEAYKSLLSDNLASRWDVDPFYLDKKRWNIGLYPYGTPPQLLHADASIVTVRAIENYFLGTANVDAHAYTETVTYSQAFRHARNANQDYFVLLEYQETERELLLKGTVFSGRNGLEVDSFNIYRTGNDRFAGALRYMCNSIAQMLPTRGLIIDRNADTVLVDLGSTDGITKDMVLTVVKAGQLRTPDNTLGLEYAQNDILGTITLTEVSESVSQGRYSRAGFFDRMNIKDEVIIVPAPVASEATDDSQEEKAQTETPQVVASVTSGEQTQLFQKRLTPTAEEITGSEYPVLSRMLQDIYVIE